MLKTLTVWITTNFGKFFTDRSTRLPYLFPEKPVCRPRSNRNRHGTTDCFNIWRRTTKKLCIVTVYLTYMQITSCEIPGWVNHKIQDCQEKYHSPHICRLYHPKCIKWKRAKEPLDEVKEDNEKAGLKLNIKKAKIMASCPITSWQIDGEKVKAVTGITFLSSKITSDGDCSNEIKTQLLLGEKMMTNLDSLLKSRDIIVLAKIPYSQSYGFFSNH